MSKKDNSGWIKNKEIYEKNPNILKVINGTKVFLMNPRTLIEYKKELGGEHQERDILFLKNYIKKYKI